MAQRTYLGEYLVKTGVITQEQLQSALQLQKYKGGFLGELLVEKGSITEQQLCQSLSQLLEINWASIDSVLITEEVIWLVPKSLAVTCHVLPLFTHHNTLYLAMENPNDIGVIKFIESKTGMQVKPMLAPIQQLQTMIRKYYFHEYSDNLDKGERAFTKTQKVKTSRPKVPQGETTKKAPPNYGAPADQERYENKERTEVQSMPNISGNQDIHNKRLGDVLVETGLITQEKLEEALRVQKQETGFLGHILVEMNMLSENQLCQVLSDLLYVESVNLKSSQIRPEVVNLIPGSLADTCRVLPLFVYNEKLYLAMENPLDPSIIQFIEFCSGNEVVPVIAPYRQLRAMIDKYYNFDRNES